MIKSAWSQNEMHGHWQCFHTSVSLTLNIVISLFEVAGVERPRMVQKVQFCGSAQLQANYWKNKQTHLEKQDVRAWKVLQGLKSTKSSLGARLATAIVFLYGRKDTADQLLGYSLPSERWKCQPLESEQHKCLEMLWKHDIPLEKTASITLVWMINFTLTDCSKILRSGCSGYTYAEKCRGFCNIAGTFSFPPCPSSFLLISPSWMFALFLKKNPYF